MSANLIKVITILIYSLLIIGELIVFRGGFQTLYYNSIMRNKMKKANAAASKKKNNDQTLEKLNTMLQITFDSEKDDLALTFIIVSAGLGFLAFVLLAVLYSVKLGILGLIGFAALPFLLLKLKMQNFQVELSKEGEDLINNLLGNYLMSYQNIREAIEMTAIELDSAPRSKKLLISLARNLTKASTREEAESAIELFRFSFSTGWGEILANNIKFAYVDGVRITDALKDLSDAITKARKTYEENRRENNESKIMLKILCPILIIAIPFAAVFAFDMEFSKFMSYQFGNETGMMWAIIIIVGYAICSLITAVITRQKMDI